jgi:hypothetical protein
MNSQARVGAATLDAKTVNPDLARMPDQSHAVRLRARERVVSNDDSGATSH